MRGYDGCCVQCMLSLDRNGVSLGCWSVVCVHQSTVVAALGFHLCPLDREIC